MWHKLSQMVKRLRSDIKDIRARKGDNYNAEARERELMLRRIEDIRDRFGRALMEAKKQTAKTGDAALSVNNSFSSEINDWKKAGMPDGEKFVLGSTGDVLQGLGAIESDIYINGDKIKTILNEHSQMTLDEIKKIPQILENPVLILKSRGVNVGKRSNTRLIVFGTLKAQDGNPVLSVLDLRPQENNLVVDDMQKVVSAYAKDNNPTQFIENSDVLYASENKKITTRLLRTIGFQMPIELNRSGYIGSISYSGQNVNISGEKFSNVVTLGSGTGNNPPGESYSYNPDSDYIGTMPINDAESANRKRALEMYRQLDAGKDIGNGKMDPAEYIYMQTGWAYDGLGNFIVDHEAPIYIDSSEQHRMTMRRADHTEGVNNALRSENAGLRETVSRAVDVARDIAGMRSQIQ